MEVSTKKIIQLGGVRLVVTRQELRQELQEYATKEDLEEWGKRIVRETRVLFEDFRAEIRAWIDGIDVRDRVSMLEERVGDNENRLNSVELRLTAVEERTLKGGS